MNSLVRVIIVFVIAACLAGVLLFVVRPKVSESRALRKLDESQKIDYQNWKTNPVGIKSSDLDVAPASEQFQADYKAFFESWNKHAKLFDEKSERINQLARMQTVAIDSDVQLLGGFEGLLNAQATLANNPDYDLNQMNLFTMSVENQQTLLTVNRNATLLRRGAFFVESEKGRKSKALEHAQVLAQLSTIDPFSIMVNQMFAISISESTLDCLDRLNYRSLSQSDKELYSELLDQVIANLETASLDYNPIVLDHVGVIKNRAITTNNSAEINGIETMTGVDLLYAAFDSKELKPAELALTYSMTMRTLGETKDTWQEQLDRAKEMRGEI